MKTVPIFFKIRSHPTSNPQNWTTCKLHATWSCHLGRGGVACGNHGLWLQHFGLNNWREIMWNRTPSIWDGGIEKCRCHIARTQGVVTDHCQERGSRGAGEAEEQAGEPGALEHWEWDWDPGSARWPGFASGSVAHRHPTRRTLILAAWPCCVLRPLPFEVAHNFLDPVLL
jgi:hypothetical protein